MKQNIKKLWSLMALMVVGLLASAMCTACSSSDDVDPAALEDVVNPTKIAHYDGSPTMASDLEVLVDYACAVQAMRLAAWNVASNDFKTGEPFCATPDDINNNTTSIYDFYDMVSVIADKADQYEAALQRLEDDGVLEQENTVGSTRGFLSDTFSFVFGMKKSREVGRNSVLAVIQQSGWQNNDGRLQALFNTVHPSRRAGYTNARQFWADFSQGKLDSKANQVFQDLYHGDAMDFGLNARELGFTPTGNMTKTAAELIEKGISVVIDAAPGMSGAMTMGKDIYNTYDATETVVKKTIDGTITREDAQKLVNQWASNLINYGDRIVNYHATGSTDGIVDMWETPKEFLGQEFANALLNDGVDFSDWVIEEVFGRDGDDVITVRAGNGQTIDLVVELDDNGNARIGVKRDSDGSFKLKSDKKKKRTVTAANKNGTRRTKKVKAGEKEVEVDMSQEAENDEPSNGYINYSPAKFEFAPQGGTQRVKLTTNYLYYGVTTSVDDGYWLEANPVAGTDEFTITAKPNNSGEARTGTVIIKATNRKGKVLKFITVKATQESTGTVVKAEPTKLEFKAEGGSLTSKVTAEGFEYFGAYVDDDEDEDWLSVVANDDVTLTVTAKANPTTTERTARIVVFATNVKEPKPEDLVTTEITVRQEAGTGQATTDLSNMVECTIYFQTSGYSAPSVRPVYLGTTTMSGNTATFTATTVKESGISWMTYTGTCTITFDEERIISGSMTYKETDNTDGVTFTEASFSFKDVKLQNHSFGKQPWSYVDYYLRKGDGSGDDHISSFSLMHRKSIEDKKTYKIIGWDSPTYYSLSDIDDWSMSISFHSADF